LRGTTLCVKIGSWAWVWAAGKTRKRGSRVNIVDVQSFTYGEKKTLERSWLNCASW